MHRPPKQCVITYNNVHTCACDIPDATGNQATQARAACGMRTGTESNDVQTSTGQATQVGRTSVSSTLTMTRGAGALGRRRRRQRWPMVLTTNAPGETTVVPTHAACRAPTRSHAGTAAHQQQLSPQPAAQRHMCVSVAALVGPRSAYHS